MKRIALLLGVAIALSACVTTVKTAVEKGGVQMGAAEITKTFTGARYKAEPAHRQGSITLNFVPGGELIVDTHKDGKWHLGENETLCLVWPDGLGWSSSGHCFVAVREASQIGLYDDIINQLRLELKKL